jgi:tetratricopeptide (TPR) repeat protein
MAVSKIFRPFSALRWVKSGFMTISLMATLPIIALAQAPPAAEESPSLSPSEVRRIDQIGTSGFSVPAADALVQEANAAISTQNYDDAIGKLEEARSIYNDISGYYQELAAMFFGIDTRQNRSNRDKALEAAQKRDETTYQLALLYRMQDEPEKAVPLLMEVLRSQQPTRDLGQQAYQQLYEMGFVEAPYEG